MSRDLHGTVERLAGMGLRTVEPYAFQQHTEEYVRAFQAFGVSAPSGHASVIAADVPETVFEAARRLGIGIVIDPYTPPERWQTAGDIEQLAERVNELSAMAITVGLRFGYHNHAHELRARIDGRHGLQVFAEHLDPQVALEVDTYWAEVGGADVPELLRQLRERTPLIHVKDGTLDGDTAKQEPLGRGEVDIPPMLEAAPEALRIIEFDAYRGDVFQGIAESVAWLQEHDR